MFRLTLFVPGFGQFRKDQQAVVDPLVITLPRFCHLFRHQGGVLRYLSLCHGGFGVDQDLFERRRMPRRRG